jgi:hypothetical protein
MCPEPWQRDTIDVGNVRLVTATRGRLQRLKISVFQPPDRALIPVAPSLLPIGAKVAEEEK